MQIILIYFVMLPYMKYFVIGFNKTATCSFHKLFEKNYLKSQHYNCWDLNIFECFSDTGNLPFINLDISNNIIIHGGGIKELSKISHFCDKYYELKINDTNHPKYTKYTKKNILNLIYLEKKYDESIFILNTRPLRQWLISRFEHGVKYNKPNDFYPYTKELGIQWISDRNNYYNDIFNYFKDKSNKLIIVDICLPNWINFISNEINIIPYECDNNISKKSNEYNNIASLVNNIFLELNYDENSQNEELINDKHMKRDVLKLFKSNII